MSLPPTIDELPYESEFLQWCLQHKVTDPSHDPARRAEALSLLVSGVRAGEIVSFDGIDSPLSRRIREHHGSSSFEMNSHWVGSSQNWVCPCCGRSKFQLSRRGRSGQILAKLVLHHDHMDESLKAAFHAAFAAAGTDIVQSSGLQLVERIANAFSAYGPILVCEDCNNADTNGKRFARAPNGFSFTPNQIRTFIRPRHHQPHEVDPAAAANAWSKARPAYELRMELIRTVAHAAATDRHWYEPVAGDAKPIPLFGHTFRPGDSEVARWIGSEALVEALAPRHAVTADYSRWRTSRAETGKTLPANYVAMLRSEPSMARAWDELPEAWSCPTCCRGKRDTVYVNGNGKVCFTPRTNRGRGAWQFAPVICNHCHSVLISLKREILQGVGMTAHDSYDLVAPEELRLLIESQPHAPHGVRQEIAQAIVDRLSWAILNDIDCCRENL